MADSTDRELQRIGSRLEAIALLLYAHDAETKEEAKKKLRERALLLLGIQRL